jgi:hypothetical protein
LTVEFCPAGCEDKIRAREAEESPLLEAVARERLIKHSSLYKSLAGVVICKVWRLALAL